VQDSGDRRTDGAAVGRGSDDCTEAEEPVHVPELGAESARGADRSGHSPRRASSVRALFLPSLSPLPPPVPAVALVTPLTGDADRALPVRGRLQQICCVARGKLFACDLSPVAYTHGGQEYLLGLNGRKGRGPVAAAGLLSVVRKELLQAAGSPPGVTAADMDDLCRCAHKQCRHFVKSRPPLLFSWSATAGPCRTINALRRGRENFALVTGLPPGARPPEPCLLVCDGCADLYRAGQRARQAVTERPLPAEEGDANPSHPGQRRGGGPRRDNRV